VSTGKSGHSSRAIDLMILPIRELIPLIQASLSRHQLTRLTITGSSMVPFIFPNDVIILKRSRCYRLGDIVMFEYPQKSFAVHRIVRRSRKGVWIRGDVQYQQVGPVPETSILGRVISVQHKGKIRKFDSEPWRVGGLLWILLFPLSPFFLDHLLSLRKKIQLGLSHLYFF